MSAGKWHSKFRKDRGINPAFGDFDLGDIADRAVQEALRKLQWELSKLHKGCHIIQYGLRAECWGPEIADPAFGPRQADPNQLIPVYTRPEPGNPAITVWLPDARDCKGECVEVKDVDGLAATRNITIKTLGTDQPGGTFALQTIDGATSAVISTAYGAMILRSDGINWLVVGSKGVAAGIDHGALSGLGDDDHTQYMLDAGTSVAGNVPKFANTDGRTMAVSGVTIDASDNVTGVTSLVIDTQSGAKAFAIEPSADQGMQAFVLPRVSLAAIGTTVFNLPIPADTACTFELCVTATKQSDPTAFWSRTLVRSARNSGGTAALGAAATTVHDDDTGGILADGSSIVLGASGGNVTITFTAGASIAVHVSATAMVKNFTKAV